MNDQELKLECLKQACARPDLSYDGILEYAQKYYDWIKTQNEHARSAFAEGNWLTETLEP